MWFEIEIDGMRIKMQISGYQHSNEENWHYQWCNVNYSFCLPDCIHYSKSNVQVLLSCEIETIEAKLDDLVNDRVAAEEVLKFIEPDFEFIFIPSYNLVENGAFVYAQEGFEISEPMVEFKVNLWFDGLTCNYFSTTFDKDEATAFRDYLRLVMGRIDVNSKIIQDYIKAGIIYADKDGI